MWSGIQSEVTAMSTPMGVVMGAVLLMVLGAALLWAIIGANDSGDRE